MEDNRDMGGTATLALAILNKISSHFDIYCKVIPNVREEELLFTLLNGESLNLIITSFDVNVESQRLDYFL